MIASTPTPTTIASTPTPTTTLNSICDEPETCAAGTDMTDCGYGWYGDDSCEYANDGTCDEPMTCAPGTDYTDCRSLGSGWGAGSGWYGDDSCASALNSICDEPETCAAVTAIPLHDRGVRLTVTHDIATR